MKNIGHSFYLTPGGSLPSRNQEKILCTSVYSAYPALLCCYGRVACFSQRVVAMFPNPPFRLYNTLQTPSSAMRQKVDIQFMTNSKRRAIARGATTKLTACWERQLRVLKTRGCPRPHARRSHQATPHARRLASAAPMPGWQLHTRIPSSQLGFVQLPAFHLPLLSSSWHSSNPTRAPDSHRLRKPTAPFATATSRGC